MFCKIHFNVAVQDLLSHVGSSAGVQPVGVQLFLTGLSNSNPGLQENSTTASMSA